MPFALWLFLIFISAPCLSNISVSCLSVAHIQKQSITMANLWIFASAPCLAVIPAFPYRRVLCRSGMPSLVTTFTSAPCFDQQLGNIFLVIPTAKTKAVCPPLSVAFTCAPFLSINSSICVLARTKQPYQPGASNITIGIYFSAASH